MARNCNCSGASCGCSVTGGSNVTVEGIGTAANPYVVSAEGQPITNLLQVDDTTSINLTLVGDGTDVDPYILSGVVTGGTHLDDAAMTAVLNDGTSDFTTDLTATIREGAVAAAQDAALAVGYGFAVRQVDPGHLFLGFGPAGEMIAGLAQSTGGRTIAQSTDNGASWTALGTPSSVNSPTAFWYSTAGTWFIHANGAIHRSTDSGVTWTQVVATGTVLNQGFADAGSGTLWAVEYLGAARVFRSTDDGVTWTVPYEFANVDGGDASPVIRHAHGIFALPSGIWVATGDNGTQNGFWKWSGSAFVRQTPSVPDPAAQDWRAVGLAERDGWFYWVQDGASAAADAPAIMKANPSNFAGTLTKLATVPSGGWYIKHLPGGELVIGSISEPGTGGIEMDYSIRLWCVDEDDRVYEVLSIPLTASPGSDFPGARNLDVRPSDGAIGIRVNNTDFSGLSYASVFGSIIRGGSSVALSRSTVPRAFSDMARAWTAPVPVTASPNITGATFAVIPDMSVTVVATGRPLLVVGQVTIVIPAGAEVMMDVAVDNVPQGRYIQASAGTDSIPIVAVLTPTRGDRVISVMWRVLAGGTITATNGYRRLSVVEM